MAIFALKPWVNSFGKISIFRLFEFVVFLAYKVNFLVLEYRKTHFPGLYQLKKKLEKWPFFDQNHELTPLEKFPFLDCLKVLFLWRTIWFFGSRMSLNIFSGLYCLKNKKLEKLQFFDQNQELTPLEKSQFFDFLTFLFLQPRKAFFRFKIS